MQSNIIDLGDIIQLARDIDEKKCIGYGKSQAILSKRMICMFTKPPIRTELSLAHHLKVTASHPKNG